MGQLLDKAKPVGDLPPLFKGLIYGPPGVGKTFLFGDAPDPIWFDFENSSDTLATSPVAAHRKIPVLRMPQDIKTVTDLCKAAKELQGSSYKTVVVDTVGAMQRFCMTEYLMLQEGAGASSLNYSEQMVKSSSRNHYQAQLQDWGFGTQLLMEFFGYLNALDKNVIFLGHDMTEKDDLTKEINTRLAVTPSLAGQLAGATSFVGYMTAKRKVPDGVTRKIILNPYGREEAKNRLGITALDLIDPTWEKLTQLIKESRNK